jgi:hypothetical protein
LRAGAKAFDFFGLFGDRLDVAFTGRIEAFFTWFHKEFVEPRYEGAQARAELRYPRPGYS